MSIDYLIDKDILEEIYTKVVLSNNYTIRRIDFIPLPIIDTERYIKEKLKKIITKKNLEYKESDVTDVTNVIISSIISAITLYFNFTSTQPYNPNLKKIAMNIISEKLSDRYMVDMLDIIDASLISNVGMYLSNSLTNTLRNMDYVNINNIMGLYTIIPYLDSVGTDDIGVVFSTHNIIKLLYAKR